MTEQERLKTDTVFVDTAIRECALMTIQKEADAQRLSLIYISEPTRPY